MPPQLVPPEEPADDFELAIRHIKMNSPLVRKLLEIDPAAGIALTGVCRIGWSEIAVVYDLAAARKSAFPDGTFRIAFSAADAAAGAFRDDELFWTPAEDESGLLLSFDDDYWQTWRQYFDLFERFGAKVTFFVQGALEPPDMVLASLLDTASVADNNYFDNSGGLADFCIKARTRGHDIGFHTSNHYDLTKVSRDIFDSETTGAAETFRGAGIPLSAFAFPFGFSEPWMQAALIPAFGITRGYGVKFRIYSPEDIRGGHIVSKAIDNIIYHDDGFFENDISLMLLAAKFFGSASGGAVVPFTTHDIAANAKWGITPDRLEYFLQTAQKLKLRFYTYSDF